MFDAEPNIIGYPGSMIEQVSNIDLLGIGRKLRKIFRERILVGKLALFGKHHDCHRCELFCQRSQIDWRIRSESDVAFDVRFPKAPFVDNAAPFSD